MAAMAGTSRVAYGVLGLHQAPKGGRAPRGDGREVGGEAEGESGREGAAEASQQCGQQCGGVQQRLEEPEAGERVTHESIL